MQWRNAPLTREREGAEARRAHAFIGGIGGATAERARLQPNAAAGLADGVHVERPLAAAACRVARLLLEREDRHDGGQDGGERGHAQRADPVADGQHLGVVPQRG